MSFLRVLVLIVLSVSLTQAQTYNLLGFVAGQSRAEIEAQVKEMGFTDGLQCAEVKPELIKPEFMLRCTADGPKGFTFTSIEIRLAGAKTFSIGLKFADASFSSVVAEAQDALGTPSDQVADERKGVRGFRWVRKGCGGFCEAVVIAHSAKDGWANLFSKQVLVEQSSLQAGGR